MLATPHIHAARARAHRSAALRLCAAFAVGLLVAACAIFAVVAAAAPPSPAYHLQIRAVLTADDDGTHAATITGAEIKAQVDTANAIWADAGIAFDFDPASDIEHVSNTLLNNDCTPVYLGSDPEPACEMEPNIEERERIGLDPAHDGKITIYYRYGGKSVTCAQFACTFSRSGGGASSRAGHYVRMPGFVNENSNPYLLAHELGHYLWNSHTFGHEPSTLADAAADVKAWVEDPNPDRPKSDGPNAFDGDGLADTPPDPGAGLWKAVKDSDCANGRGDDTQSLTVTFSDASTKTYELAPDRTNVMSYYLCTALGVTSSPQQQARARTAVEDLNRANLLGTTPSFAQLDTVWSSTWPSGSTRIASFRFENRPHLLAYDGATGEARIERGTADANDGPKAVWSGAWTTGWTSLVPLQLNGTPHLLLYKTATGDAKIVRVKAGGLGITTVMTAAWKPGWTSIVPFALNGAPRLLLYNVATGDAKAVQVASNGTAIATLWTSLWKAGWTSLAPLVVGASPHLLLYNAASGDAKLVDVDPGGVSTVWMSLWKTGWTALMPFDRGAQQRLLLYSETTGEAKAVRLGAGGWATVYLATWSSGYTSLAPYRLNGLWHTLVYKPGGTAKLLRITQ